MGILSKLFGRKSQVPARGSPKRPGEPKFADPMECYQAIASELAQLAAPGWSRIEVEAVPGEDSINLVIVSSDADGNSESDYTPVRLDEYFMLLRALVSTEEKGFYKKCRFSLRNTGEFNADFEYA